MIPPASVQQKWSLLAIATLIPMTFVGISDRKETAQAHQQVSGKQAIANGTHVYGNSPQPNQLARNYVVFERKNSKVVGAFYSPQSDFTCFTGKIQGTRLEVKTVVLGQPKIQEVKAQLSTLYPLQDVSTNDQRMLTLCKQKTIARMNRQ